MTSISFGFPSSNEGEMARQVVTILKDGQSLNGATETAQQAKTLASKHDDQNSTLRFGAYSCTHTYGHSYTINKEMQY